MNFGKVLTFKEKAKLAYIDYKIKDNVRIQAVMRHDQPFYVLFSIAWLPLITRYLGNYKLNYSL